MDARAIYVTEDDLSRLEEILDTITFRDRKDLQRLEDELASATIVAPRDVPPNVVTMNSRVKLRDVHADKEMTISLVFPNDAKEKSPFCHPSGPLFSALKPAIPWTWQSVRLPKKSGSRRFSISPGRRDVMTCETSAGDQYASDTQREGDEAP